MISLSLSNRICHLQRKDDDWKMPPRFLTVFVHLQRTLAFVEWWVKRDEICINHSHECSTILKLHCWGPIDSDYFWRSILTSKNFFQIYTINLKKSRWQTEKILRCTEKKFRSAGPEIFLRFETDLNFSRPWFSEIKVQIKWLPDWTEKGLFLLHELFLEQLKTYHTLLREHICLA